MVHSLDEELLHDRVPIWWPKKRTTQENNGESTPRHFRFVNRDESDLPQFLYPTSIPISTPCLSRATFSLERRSVVTPALIYPYGSDGDQALYHSTIKEHSRCNLPAARFLLGAINCQLRDEGRVRIISFLELVHEADARHLLPRYTCGTLHFHFYSRLLNPAVKEKV
ncbi:hypothetical protein EVAR_67940_1 [Eumeta japonica]|uniref:Uncharacterized protein n=1 Tax=Eumeta variegata TaxID=151549 RepID=A0A4C2A7E5_EUMVA|nr:hypothetical protein EVAR_67940_1 [Eumeta japonica]